MRPPGITGGIMDHAVRHLRLQGVASMRPPGITGGIPPYFCPVSSRHRSGSCFNEAAGYHRRNPTYQGEENGNDDYLASMRPPGITGGIPPF